VREIQGHLEEMYGTEVSPSLISAVTDAVSEDVKVWQARPLDPLYPILYLDCIHVKVRDAGAVRTKAVYLAIGVTWMGTRKYWAVDRPNRGRQVLAAGGHRAEDAGRARYFYRLCRRAQRLPGSHRGSLSESGCAAVHRAYGPQQPELCAVENAEGSRRRSEVDLHLIDVELADKCWPTSRKNGTRITVDWLSWRRNWARISLFRLSAGNPKSNLYDKRHRSINMSLRKVIKLAVHPTDEAVTKLFTWR